MPIPIAAMSASLSMSDNGFSNVAKIATGSIAALGAAVTAAGIAITKLTLDQFPLIDRTAKLSEELDVATESLEAFKFASQLAGGSTLSLDKALQRLNRSVGEARMGLSTPIRGFKALGIEIDEIKSLRTEDIFLKIADAVSNMNNAQDRATAITALFGRAGAELTVLLKGGSDALREAKKEAEELGLTFSKIDAKRVEEANDSVVRMKSAFRGIFNLLAIEFAPTVKVFAIALKDLLVNFRKELPALITKIKTALPPVIDGFAELGAVTQTFIEGSVIMWKVMFENWNKYLNLMKKVSPAFAMLASEMVEATDGQFEFSSAIKKNQATWRKWATGVKNDIKRVTAEMDEFKESLPDVGNVDIDTSAFGDLEAKFKGVDTKKLSTDLENQRNLMKEIVAPLTDIKVKKEDKPSQIIDTTVAAVESASKQAIDITAKFLQGGGESVVEENAKANKESAEANKKQVDKLNDLNSFLEDFSDNTISSF